MKVEELKTKIKVIFPNESEIFAVEEAKDKLVKTLETKKLIEIDFERVNSIDTTFVQLYLSYVKTLKNEDKKFQVKNISTCVKTVLELYGINIL